MSFSYGKANSELTPAAFVYNCIAIYFMYRWSGQKVARYKKEFDPKVFPGKRWQFFPPFC